MSTVTKRSGGCHCGRVRFEVEVDLSQPAISCNCSICARSGSLLAFAPAERFTLLSGEDALTDYQFNKKVIHHLFCKTCGIKSFARAERGGAPVIAINVRCLDDVDLERLEVKAIDGKSR